MPNLLFAKAVLLAALVVPAPARAADATNPPAPQPQGRTAATRPLGYRSGRLADAPLCRIHGRFTPPGGRLLQAISFIRANLTYQTHRETGKWQPHPAPETTTHTEPRALRSLVDPDGTFNTVVPQGTTVTFYRHYRVGGAAYEVPPQTVEVPLGCDEKAVRLEAAAVALMRLRGRVLDEATGRPLAGFTVHLQYWPPGLPPRSHPRGHGPGRYRRDASAGDAAVSSGPHVSRPRVARVKTRRPADPEHIRPTQSATCTTCDPDGGFAFVVPRRKDAVFMLSVRPPASFPEALRWKATHPFRAVQIDDITAHQDRPYVWKIPSRTPSLILEYRTAAGDPLPLPKAKGKTCIRGRLHEIVDPATVRDRVETTPEGHKIEYDYSKSVGEDGLPFWKLDKETRFVENGQPRLVATYDVPITTIQHAPIRQYAKGRTTQMFFDLDKAGRYAVVLYADDTPYRPVPDDAVIAFEPQKGKTVRRTIRVQRAKGTPADAP